MDRPSDIGRFQFVVLSSLRAAQLLRGCVPKVDGGHKRTVTAQLEISLGMVKQDFTPVAVAVTDAIPVLAAATAETPAW
jgi:hypothetical protein